MKGSDESQLGELRRSRLLGPLPVLRVPLADAKDVPRCPFVPRFVITRDDAIIAGDGRGRYFASATPFLPFGHAIAVESRD